MNRGTKGASTRPSGSAADAVSLPHSQAPAAAEPLHDGWEQFWFTPEPSHSLRMVRTGLGLLAALYFVSHWADIGYWFGAEGVLSTARLVRINELSEAAGAARWRVSPLYWIESTTGLRLVLAVGTFASLLTAVGIGGRWSIAVAWGTLISLASRSWAIVGIAEIPLALGLAGLLIGGPGTALIGRRLERYSWTIGLARRLLEIHVAALVVATALTQLASEAWWNGEGALRLVLPVDGPPWDLTRIGNSPLLSATLTHAIVWIPLVCVPLLWGAGGAAARRRRAAALVLIAHAAVVAILSGQLLYGAAIAVLLSLFLIPRGPGGPQDGE